jgi:hypothetical protein
MIFGYIRIIYRFARSSDRLKAQWRFAGFKPLPLTSSRPRGFVEEAESILSSCPFLIKAELNGHLPARPVLKTTKAPSALMFGQN